MALRAVGLLAESRQRSYSWGFLEAWKTEPESAIRDSAPRSFAQGLIFPRYGFMSPTGPKSEAHALPGSPWFLIFPYESAPR